MEMMKRQKLLDNYRGTKNLKVMSCVELEEETKTQTKTGRRLKKRKFSFLIELISVILLMLLMFSSFPCASTISALNHHHDQDIILSPNPAKITSGKYSYFQQSNDVAVETSTRVLWEEPLKETISLALGTNSKISKNAIMKATYTGFNDLPAHNFGDISILAKGKLKQYANKTFSFEQMNEKCDDKCQANADKFLENVTALWMVERIRHRDRSEHRFDLKFTIVPINNDIEHIDHNILENRLKSHMKKSYILRDSDYPKYFGNRRTDLFNSGFSRSLSSLMNPNNMLHTILGLNISPPQHQPQQGSLGTVLSSNNNNIDHQHNQEIIKDARLNTGEFYMGSKINSPNQKLNYHSTTTNVIAPGNLKIKFPDSHQHHNNLPLQNSAPQRGQQRPKAEIYHRNIYHGNNNMIGDPRGQGGDNLHVGSQEHSNFHYYHHHHHQMPPKTQQTQQTLSAAVPLYSFPIDMNIIQIPAALPLSLQFSTPTNPSNLWIPQPEVTTFRYPQIVGIQQQQPQQQQQQIQYLPLAAPKPLKSLPMRSSAEQVRHTAVVNHQFSRPDPMYHHQSLPGAKTEATTSHSTRQNNYANVRQKTASSIQVNKYDDEDDSDFKPITPTYDVRKYKNNLRFPSTTVSPIISSTSKKPLHQSNKIYSDSAERGSISNAVTILPTIIVQSERENEIGGYRVVSERTTMSTTEKPVLKWMPKSSNKNKNKTVVVTPTINSFLPTTLIPNNETTSTTQSISTKIQQQQLFRGRNRFNSNKRNSTSSLRLATISPTAELSTTKLNRKKSSSSSATTTTTQLPSSTLFPAYVTVTPIPMTDESPVTVQSLSTSISFEVNGEQQTTTTPGYEVVSAGVEVIKTNSSNVKLFRASAVPEKFDDLTFSILSHAKALEEDDRLLLVDSNDDDVGNGLKKKV